MMKSLSTKKIVIAMLAVLFAFSLMFAGLTANKASANTDLEEITLSTTMESSAQMRLTNPTGMRFIINVDEADLELFGEDVKVVTMITQKNLLDAKGISVEEFDKDTDVKKAEVVFGASHFQAAKDVYGEIKLTATILEISDKNIAKDYVAKTYITDGEKIGYVEQATVSSIFEVATYWAEQGLGAEDEQTQAVLDRYTKSFTLTMIGAPADVGTLKIPYGSKLSDLLGNPPACYTVLVKDADGNEVSFDSIVTSDLTMEITAENHTWVDGKCTVDGCGAKCPHDWDGADCTICDMTREPSVAETTYGADYVAIVDGKVAIDASAINETVDLASVTAVAINGANAEFVIDGNNIVVTTSVYGENVKFAITVANAEEYKAVTFETIVATHVINDEAEWRSYMSQQRQKSYAVITADITMATEAEVTKGSDPFYTNFTINGLNHKLRNVYDYSGLFGGGISGATIKNLDISVKAMGGSIGDQIVGTVTLDNVKWEVRRNGGAGTNIFTKKFYDANTKLVLKNSTITINQASEFLQRKDVFINEANAIGTIEMINSTIYCTGTMVKVGETYNGAVWGSKVIMDSNSWIEDKYDTVTYADQYVTTNGSVITVDASKISGATVSGVTSAIVGTTTCSASQSGNTISINSSIKGETKLQLVAGNKVYIVGDIIVANHVLSDETTFKAWATAGHGKSGDRYAVISQDITLTEDVEINMAWFGGYTLNGLGHTIKNLYDYSGFTNEGTGNVVIKNVTMNIKTCSSVFGRDWYGTINFINVTINASVPGHAITKQLLFDAIRGGTTCNFTDCTININMDRTKQDIAMPLYSINTSQGSSIKMNLVNTVIKSTGTIGDISSDVTLDANSKIIDKNGTK